MQHPIAACGECGIVGNQNERRAALASQLEHGVLLTRTGQDHVAIFYSSCVRSWDATYLVTLQTPPSGTVCSA